MSCLVRDAQWWSWKEPHVTMWGCIPPPVGPVRRYKKWKMPSPQIAHFVAEQMTKANVNAIGGAFNKREAVTWDVGSTWLKSKKSEKNIKEQSFLPRGGRCKRHLYFRSIMWFENVLVSSVFRFLSILSICQPCMNGSNAQLRKSERTFCWRLENKNVSNIFGHTTEQSSDSYRSFS